MRTIRNTNVAVIGGAGFLGSHLVDHLIQDRGCNVMVIDNLVAGRREFVHPKATFIHHDITGSEDYLRNVFKANQVEYVFIYAAYPYIPTSFARPLHVCNVNFMGAVKVINAAQEAGCRATLQISSAEIFGDAGTQEYEAPLSSSVIVEHVSINEDAPVVPHSSYGVSKAAVDNYVQCAWKERQTPCIALRQFNCVGERETHPYVVPEIIGQLANQGPANVSHKGLTTTLNAKAVVKLGNNSFRDFLYAGDQARMATELLERGEFGKVYNLGSETGIKIYDLAKLIGKVMGFADVVVERDESRVRPWEIWHLQAQCDKLYSVIKSRPQVSLEDALRRTVTWYEANGRKWPWELQRTQST